MSTVTRLHGRRGLAEPTALLSRVRDVDGRLWVRYTTAQTRTPWLGASRPEDGPARSVKRAWWQIAADHVVDNVGFQP